MATRSTAQTIQHGLQTTTGTASAAFSIPIPRSSMVVVNVTVGAWDGSSNKAGASLQFLAASTSAGVVSLTNSVTNLLSGGTIDLALAGITVAMSTTTDAVVLTCTGIVGASLTWACQSNFRLMILP